MFSNCNVEKLMEELKIVIKGDRESYESYENLLEDAMNGSYNTIGYAKAKKEVKEYGIDILMAMDVMKDLELSVRDYETFINIIKDFVVEGIIQKLIEEEKENEIDED